MHDPLVVAFEIRRPWPRVSRVHPSKNIRWQWARNGPWWQPSAWSSFPVLAGRALYFPPMVTVWHREPGGADSGEVCKHYVRTQQSDGTWSTRVLHGWRWHIHHWKIQLQPLQALRRWLLTRCAWCGGRSRKGDPVNVSHQWDGPRGRWWRGEPGLYHGDCSAIAAAHRTCICVDPVLSSDTYGSCVCCGKRRAFGTTPAQLGRTRVLAAVPAGKRDPGAYRQVCDLAAAEWAEATK